MNSSLFDFGLGTNKSKPMNQQNSSSSTTQSRPLNQSWQPNKPSWTHPPAPAQSSRPGLSNPRQPTSMVGDIFGKSWNSSAPSGGIGIVEKNPNLFSDLVSFGQNKSSNNVPLKNATPVSAPSSTNTPYSMGNLANSLPKTDNSVKSGGGNWGGSGISDSNASTLNSSSSNSNVGKSANLGGPSMRSSMRSLGGGIVGGGGMDSNKDPFGSLVDFGTKQGSSLNAASKSSESASASNVDDLGFGDFQNASKGSASGVSSPDDFGFGSFQNASQGSATGVSSSDLFGNSMNGMGASSGLGSKMDDFGMSPNNLTSQTQSWSTSVDPLDMLFTSSSSSAAPSASGGTGSEPFAGIDDWGADAGFGDHDAGGTTELEGLPPPPAGVTASGAMNKGMDNQKQGQYADAIKWLSWAVILLEKAGDDALAVEVLSCRASCYKEVGEYKKAVADCTKVLEQDGENVTVLVQRALLYESMEKYKLGAEDLRTVLKLDPGNRVARSTIHRLTKMAS
ncbi:Tetratricopeptide repeat [Dillenia turbinata]|uniref:Tetratricopeptide repeat n=1 Tax=Dillenia turbinata TaxID=194707 RepID=A0AAN8Z842_9MAGN